MTINQGTSSYARTHTATYDGLGRQTDGVVTSNEYGTEIPRPFTYDHDWAVGTYTRTGPDNVQTFVQLDADNRVQFVRRGPAAAPLMTATYTYLSNDLVQSVTYGNGASTWYTYDAARRVTQIDHRNAVGLAMLRMDYTYKVNDLPETIVESDNLGGSWITRATTTFSYDRRSRLTSEYRSGQNAYRHAYFYDAGGNRTRKYDTFNWRVTVYYYDVDADVNPPQASNPYGSFNNRLEYFKVFDTTQSPTNPGDPGALVSTSWYYYTAAGNVDRVVTREEPTGGAVAAASSVETQGGTVGTTVEGAPEATALVTGGDCSVGSSKYTATRFGYAMNGAAVAYVLGESWCWDGASTCPVSYSALWAREFRYDGARARYMNRPLNTTTFAPLTTQPTVWSDYDGDETYGDFTVSGTTVTNTDAYEPGLWRKIGSVADYLHNDHLGTLRQTSNTSGAAGGSDVFTAFGERISGTSDRFGYAGAWGYQSHTEFPFLHVGARYYDPSTGRFLQRDPIGIAGGPNVYTYTFNIPTIFIDEDGLSTNNPGGAAGNTPAGARQVIEIMKDLAKQTGKKSLKEWETKKRKYDAAKDLVKSMKDVLKNTSGKKSRDALKKQIADLADDVKGHEKQLRQLWPELFELLCGG